MESIVKIVELNGNHLVREYADEIERMLGSKMKSVKVRAIKNDLNNHHYVIKKYKTNMEFMDF